MPTLRFDHYGGSITFHRLTVVAAIFRDDHAGRGDSMNTLDGITAELSCWRGKLEALEGKAIEAAELPPDDGAFLLASLAIQERMIVEHIADLTAKLATEAERVETRPRRKHARAFPG